ncbi:MAG: glutamine--fructose-6-phosphate transaminase (isomerizing) [Candidatus Omnitrophota bacterium]|nr:glutamine--fructose-6-phosphate transaminase (isomerizing) [Candidatus Omnitrophota bacterium]MBU2527896.1 glutamine--fructose-6-phosphate transaminase (isomerizing) [bacterium]MBU3929249.1 glutamine--fructose-6-phosphate transaminase (isomerizing) [bacterium]MBU4122088.1 glutamine--fructose-6-phosphate transaminase (isomerizing) [bacterium]
MCGIVGYTGGKPALSVLIRGLKKLEYRGYDSAGIAINSPAGFILRRCKGKVSSLDKLVSSEKIKGNTGLGHTRWATHGQPSEENAHPHTDCSGRIVVVHNGIIENYIDLKTKLKARKHKFKSETDTEIIPHLIEEKLKKEKNLLKAVQSAISEIRGSYALGIMSRDEPDTIIAARKDTPLIIGLGKNENFIASDIPAILKHTRDIILLDDGETAVIKPASVAVFDAKGRRVKKKISHIDWNPSMAEREGYRHFMLKEIFEQPRAIQDTLRGKLNLDKGYIHLEDIGLTAPYVKKIKKIFIVACGTAYHAGMVGKFLIEKMIGIPCETDIASEFRYRSPVMNKSDLFIIISQSGETADTLAALRMAKKHGLKTLSVCNVIGSSAARETDGMIFTHAGPEIGVASTKAFTTQLIAMYLLTLYLGRIRGAIPRHDAIKIMTGILKIPQQIRTILKKSKVIAKVARKYSKKRDFLYIGRNLNYPIALEGALKLKEISYIHAEGYAAGEMKHGPIALIDKDMPIVAIATAGEVYEKLLSNVQEAKARNGIIIAVANAGDRNVSKSAAETLYVPSTMEELSPLLNVIPLQLLSYYIALYRGCDIDQPRNLAKSVVVE